MMTDHRTSEANDDTRQHSMDPFLQSMTFATFITTTTTRPLRTNVNQLEMKDNQSITVSRPRIGEQQHRFNDTCDCSDDECRMMIRQRMRRKLQRIKDGYDTKEMDSTLSFVPPTIQDAIDAYKRQKVMTEPIKRRQVRTLIHRDNKSTIAFWEWILPVGGEPLVEFSNPNLCRIVWVRKLSMKLQTIGNGIIGSSKEERTRRTLHDIKEDDVILLGSHATTPILANSKDSNDTTSKEAISSQQQKQTAIGWIYDLPNNNNPSLAFDEDDDNDLPNSQIENDFVDSILNDDNRRQLTNDGSPAVLVIAKVPIHLLTIQSLINKTSGTSDVSSMESSSCIDLLVRSVQLTLMNVLDLKEHETSPDSPTVNKTLQLPQLLTSYSASSTFSRLIKFDPKQSKIIKSVFQRIQDDSATIKVQQVNQWHDDVVVDII
jgi:hypothetical protein